MGSTPDIVGSYRIIRQLGEGGMGTVFEAVHETIERRVAIKILKAEFARVPEVAIRFVNEARAVNRVEHPGIVQISDYGRLPDDTAYIVMEYLRGETLEQHIQRSGGTLLLADALDVSGQIAAALAAAHAQGIVHRDIKPQNIMLIADPQFPERTRIKVLDFGLAKLAVPGVSPFFKTSNNSILGTPLYMSPEQCAGAGKVDAQSDVYSLGCLLYETLCGRPPFTAEGVGQLLGMHMYDPPEPLGRLAPRTPKPVVQLVHAMLSKEKEHRPAMSEVAKKLSELQRLVPIAKHDPFGSQQAPGCDESKNIAFGATLAQVAREPNTSLRSRLLYRVLAGVACVAITLWWGLHYLRQPRSTDTVSPRDMHVELATDRARPISNKLLGDIQDAGDAPVPLSKRIQLQIETDPAEAEVISAADGRLLGVTPWHLEQQAQPATMDVRLQRSGFANKVLQLDLSRDATYRERLTPLAVRLPHPIPNRKQRSASGAVRHADPRQPTAVVNQPVKESIPLED